jgi:hypothetical protein
LHFRMKLRASCSVKSPCSSSSMSISLASKEVNAVVVHIYVCPHRLRQMKRWLSTFSCVAIFIVFVKVHKKTSLVGRSSLCLLVGNALCRAITTLPEEKVVEVQIVE